MTHKKTDKAAKKTASYAAFSRAKQAVRDYELCSFKFPTSDFHFRGLLKISDFPVLMELTSTSEECLA